MLKKLQRKFVLLTTLISLIVMIIIAVSINLTSYYSLQQNADDLIELIHENELEFSDGLKQPPSYLPRETAFTTRFFIVKTDPQNNL